MDIKIFLGMGISLTEQGYDTLDDDIAKILLYINNKESEKMKDKMNNGSKTSGQTSFGKRGFNR